MNVPQGSITNGSPVTEGFLFLIVNLNRILAEDWEDNDEIKARINRAIAESLNTAI